MNVLNFFFKKQRQVESLIYSYLDNLKMTGKHFDDAMNTCLESGICERFDFLTAQTHKFESKAENTQSEEESNQKTPSRLRERVHLSGMKQ